MSRHAPPFSGIWPAMLTPFDADEQLDLKATSRLITHLIGQGAGGLYICGSTGDAPLMLTEERMRFTEYVIGEVAGEVPVIVHVGHTSPIAAMELARHTRTLDVDGVSSVPPPLYRYSPGQVASYWTGLSEASGAPFYGYVMQDLGANMVQIEHWVETMRRVPNLAGVKFTHDDMFQLALLRRFGGESFNIFSGSDQSCLAARVQGADGAIGSSYNPGLALWKRMYDAYDAGDRELAERLMVRCAEVVGKFLTGYFNAKLKLVLRMQGVDIGPARWPLAPDVDIPASEIEELVRLIASQDLLPITKRD